MSWDEDYSDDAPPHTDADAPEFSDAEPFDLSDLWPEEKPLDNPTKEKIIEVYKEASNVLKPAIEKVKETVRGSGVSPDQFRKAENDFSDRGDDTDHEVRRIVSDVGDLLEFEKENGKDDQTKE